MQAHGQSHNKSQGQSQGQLQGKSQGNVGGVQVRCHYGNRAGNRLPPEVLTDAEVRLIMKACNVNRVTGARNAALIVVLYRCGLRISEAISLHVKDVELAAGVMRVLWGKGGRSRVVGVDPGTAEVIGSWMTTRSLLGVPREAPLFCTLHGTPIAPSYIRRRLSHLAKQAGIEKRIHAHGFRHTHAAQLRSEGVDIGIISKQLGHASILTTVRYLDHIAPTSVIEAMRKRVWDGGGESWSKGEL